VHKYTILGKLVISRLIDEDSFRYCTALHSNIKRTHEKHRDAKKWLVSQDLFPEFRYTAQNCQQCQHLKTKKIFENSEIQKSDSGDRR